MYLGSPGLSCHTYSACLLHGIVPNTCFTEALWAVRITHLVAWIRRIEIVIRNCLGPIAGVCTFCAFLSSLCCVEMYHETHLRSTALLPGFGQVTIVSLALRRCISSLMSLLMDHKEHLVRRRNEATKRRVYEVDWYNFDRPAPV